MKLLAIDSSGLVASVAVVSEETLLAEFTVNYKKTHSETLLPMLEKIIQMLELDMSEVDAIAVAAGPGSFTGLRIGSATAKGLGLVLGKPLVPVPTLEAMAYNLYGTDKLICPMMDARRNQVYTGLFESCSDRFSTVLEQCAMDVDDIMNRINDIGREVIYLGDGSEAQRNRIMEKTRVSCHFAPAHLNRQRAGSVGALGLIYYRKGLVQAAAEHQPIYLRVSQAEREREEKERKSIPGKEPVC